MRIALAPLMITFVNVGFEGSSANRNRVLPKILPGFLILSSVAERCVGKSDRRCALGQHLRHGLFDGRIIGIGDGRIVGQKAALLPRDAGPQAIIRITISSPVVFYLPVLVLRDRTRL